MNPNERHGKFSGLTLAAGLLITWFAGENPLRVLAILYRSAFGSRYDLGMTVFYATPLVFTGISVAIAFHAGLFNIGAEGQLTLGALAAAAIGALWPKCPVLLAPLIATAGMTFAGALWGAIPGWLRVRRLQAQRQGWAPALRARGTAIMGRR